MSKNKPKWLKPVPENWTEYLEKMTDKELITYVRNDDYLSDPEYQRYALIAIEVLANRFEKAIKSRKVTNVAG